MIRLFETDHSHWTFDTERLVYARRPRRELTDGDGAGFALHPSVPYVAGLTPYLALDVSPSGNGEVMLRITRADGGLRTTIAREVFSA